MTWWGKGGDRFALDFHVFCLCRCVCAIAPLLAKGRNCKIGCVCVCELCLLQLGYRNCVSHLLRFSMILLLID